jgi:hypothetical protein
MSFFLNFLLAEEVKILVGQKFSFVGGLGLGVGGFRV